MNKQIRSGLAVVVFVLILFLAGCNSVPGFKIAPDQSIKETDSFSERIAIRNCADYEHEKIIPITEEYPILVNIDIAEQAFSEETGDPVEISQNLREKLKNQIGKEFENLYTEIKTKADQKNLVVPAYSVREFEVQWKELCHCSTVAFDMDKQTYTANFSYKIEYPTLGNFNTEACTA
jgi:hypothetical protein